MRYIYLVRKISIDGGVTADAPGGWVGNVIDSLNCYVVLMIDVDLQAPVLGVDVSVQQVKDEMAESGNIDALLPIRVPNELTQQEVDGIFSFLGTSTPSFTADDIRDRWRKDGA